MALLRVGLSRLLIFTTLFLTILSLEGCHRRYDNAFMPLVDRSFKLPKRVKGTSDTRLITKIRNFNRQGISKVMTIGSDYLISIPSYVLFPDQSPRLTWNAYGTLNRVAYLLKEFRKVAVTVTAYSSQYVSLKRERALTLARARVIADYLWSQGIDSRFIFVEGAGSEKPIAKLNQGVDQGSRSRVEITFRDAII